MKGFHSSKDSNPEKKRIEKEEKKKTKKEKKSSTPKQNHDQNQRSEEITP